MTTSPAGGSLPPVTVARFEQVTILIERLAQEKTSIFLEAMTGHIEQRQQAAARGLSSTEAVAVAGELASRLGRDDVIALAAEVQQSGLQAADPPDPKELLLAAGLRTAPAFLDAALRVCAMIELPAGAFEAGLEHDDLDQRVDEHCVDLRKLPIAEGRQRASVALTHFTSQVGGGTPGEAWSLLTGTVWQAIKQAYSQLDGSPSSWSTSLVEPTAGRDETP